MASQFSGHVTVGTNVTNRRDLELLWGNISVPPRHAAMVSFRQNRVEALDVQLFCRVHPRRGPCAGPCCRGRRTPLWTRDEMRSDFAHVYRASALSLEVRRKDVLLPGHFRLLFSFFPRGEAPRKLTRGFWNCCVSDYPRFHHHLACNLRTECEDGRDETGRCAFSSARCRGLVALCGRCYRVLPTLLDCDVTESTDCRYTGDRHDYRWARAHCQALGGLLGVPRCVPGWADTLLGLAKVHRGRLLDLWVGLYTADPALPSMYTYEIVSEDNTVLYHYLRCGFSVLYRAKECLYYHGNHYPRDCSHHLSHGAVCEFSANVTVDSSDPPVSISLTDTRFLASADDPSLTLWYG